MSIVTLLSQRAAIERATPAVSENGDVQLTWSTVATDVPCRLEVVNMEAASQDSGEVLRVRAQAWFTPGTDLSARGAQQQSDRVTVDGNIYRVDAVWDGGGPRGLFLIATLRRDT